MNSMITRPRINSTRIKLAVQREKEEQLQTTSSSDGSLSNYYADFLEPGESLEALLKKDVSLDIVYDDVINTEEAIYNQITRQYGHLLDAKDEIRKRDLPRVVATLLTQKNLNIEEKRFLFTRITNQYLGHGILQALWNDKTITEIIGNGPEDIWIEIAGELQKVGPEGQIYKDIKFGNAADYKAYVHDLFSQTKRPLDKINCLENGELIDGSRISVNWPSITKYPSFNIRKPPTSTIRYTPETFISTGAATEVMMEFLGIATEAYRNMLLLGATGSGKTTVLRILIEEYTRKDRLVYMEDARELNPKHPHFVSLQTIERDKNPIDYAKLIRQSLRMRPDRIGIQEVRGGSEASGILKAIMAGHDGVITTAHAGSPEQIVFLLIIWLKESGINVDEMYLRKMVHESLDLLVFTQRMPDGSRKITEIWEVLPWDGQAPGFNKLFYYDYRKDEHVQSGYVSQRFLDRCIKHGVFIPQKFIQKEGV